MISVPLLERLMSGDAAAQAYLHESLTVEQRCRGLLAVVTQLQQGQVPPAHLVHLAAVLLRRDIASLALDNHHANDDTFAANSSTNTTTATSLLMEMVEPLMQLLSLPTLSSSSSVRLAMEHCVAEMVASLDVLSASVGNNTAAASSTLVQSILNQNQQQQQPHTTSSLSLWTALAEQAPRAFAASRVWQQLPLDSMSNHNAALWLRLVVAAATAVDEYQAASDSSISAAVAALHEMGRLYLAPWLAIMNANCCRSNSKETTLIWQYLVQAAEDVPHLLLNVDTLPVLLPVCGASLSTDERLQVVQTMVLLWQAYKQESSSQSQLQSPSPMAAILAQHHANLLQQAVMACWCTMKGDFVDGTDESMYDNDAWANEPASLQNDSGTAEYANVDDDDDNEHCRYSELLLSELLRLFPDAVLAVLLPLVQDALSSLSSSQSSSRPMSQQQQRQQRATCAALVAVQCSLEVVPVAMATHLHAVVQMAIFHANSGGGSTQSSMSVASAGNNCARIQFHAVRLLGVVCEAEGAASVFDAAHWTAILQCLAQCVAAAQHVTCTKVAAMACQALVSYCRPMATAGGSSAAAMTTVEGSEATVPPQHTVLLSYIADVVQALVNGPLSLDNAHGTFNTRTTGTIVVQLRAVGALACCAQVVGRAAFAPFYSMVMPRLLTLASATTTATSNGNTGSVSYELAQLAGSSLEAATMIGQAVSVSSSSSQLDDDDIGTENEADLFTADAHRIMQWVLPALEQGEQYGGVGHNSHNLPMDLMLSACARIATVLQADYAPYVERVLPHLLRRAADANSVEFSEGDVAGLDETKQQQVVVDEDLGTESLTVAVPGRGLTKVTVNTTKIQEKAQAARAVYEHAVALQDCFGPYCQACLDVFVPLVEFKFSSEIRATAAQTVAAVFDAACSAGASNESMDLAKMYLPRLVTKISRQMAEEDIVNVEVVHALATSLCDVCHSMYAYRLDGQVEGEIVGNLSESDVTSVVQHCIQGMSACLKRRERITSALVGENLSGSDERNELQRSLSGEEELLIPLVDSTGYLLKCFGPRSATIFEASVAPTLGPFLGTGHDLRARLSAVCLFDDCVEYCGTNAAAKFGPHLLVGIQNGLLLPNQSPDAELERAAIYGIAQLARHAPVDVLAPHAHALVQELWRRVNRSKPSSETDSLGAAVFENAVSALASMILFDNAPFRNASLLNRDEVGEVFLTSLPLREDEDEAKICHAEFCTMVESGNLPRLQSDMLASIVKNILTLVHDGEDVATDETCHRLQAILNHVQQSPTTATNVPGTSTAAGDAAPMAGFARWVSP